MSEHSTAPRGTLLGLLLLAASAPSRGTPPEWPSKFSVAIATNHTWRVRSTDHPVLGKMYYNWQLRALRVDHGAGNFECRHFYRTSKGCSLLHLPTGTYRLLQHPLPAGQPRCCRDPFLAQITAPPPDWAIRGHPSAPCKATLPDTGYQGLEYRYLSTGNCTNRTSGDDSGCHTYVVRGEPGAALPLLFSFPASGGLQDWYYNASSQVINDTSMPDSIFRLDDGCINTDCPKSSEAVSRSPAALEGLRAAWNRSAQ